MSVVKGDFKLEVVFSGEGYTDSWETVYTFLTVEEMLAFDKGIKVASGNVVLRTRRV